MKKPIEPSDLIPVQIGTGIVSFMLAAASPAYGMDELEYLSEVPIKGEEEEGEGASWMASSLPLQQIEAIAHRDELIPPAPRATPDRRSSGAAVRAEVPVGHAGSSQEQRAFFEEFTALRVELAQLKDAHASEQRELRELRERVQVLETRLLDALALYDLAGEEAPENPHARWIEANLEELRRYPATWVAVDPARGIVLHAKDGEEFAEKLDALPPEERARLLPFNTSMYV